MHALRPFVLLDKPSSKGCLLNCQAKAAPAACCMRFSDGEMEDTTSPLRIALHKPRRRQGLASPGRPPAARSGLAPGATSPRGAGVKRRRGPHVRNRDSGVWRVFCKKIPLWLHALSSYFKLEKIRIGIAKVIIEKRFSRSLWRIRGRADPQSLACARAGANQLRESGASRR